MSSDLTFITNEQGKHLGERFGVLLGDNTRLFDCLVGYFFISGFHKLHPALTKTEKIRILIGIKTDGATYELIQTAKTQQEFVLESHAQVRERVPGEILAEFQKSGDSSHIEEGVRKFVEWIKSGKLEVRAYPSERVHAKLYIMTFHEGDRDKGRVITGSSNLTAAGLQENLEFNVELKNRSDYEFALQKFNELWARSVDVTKDYVTTIEVKSPFAQFTPYELYLKFLYEYFRGELNLPDEIEDMYLPAGFKKLKYQEEAVLNARKVLDEYGGAFLSDVVGLGKTYMSALLAQHLNERCLVIAPPHLLDEHNPGSWPNVFREFGVRGHLCESLGKLESLLERDLEKFKTVFIDESHRFRTEDTQSFEMLAQICRGRDVIKTSFGKSFHQRRMDYFYFFFHRGLLLARPTGIVNFITTNYYLTATYADKLRLHMKESASVSAVINFEKVKLFQSAQGQHNAITTLVKGHDPAFEAEVAVTRREGNLDSDTLSGILRWTDTETAYGRISNRQLFDGSRNYIRLVTDGNNNEQSLQSTLSKIKKGGPPLVTVAEIVQGIVTGANQATEKQITEYKLDALHGDGIFILSEREAKGLHLLKRERDFIKQWFKNSDISRWTTAPETDKRLIYIRADSEFEDAEIPNLLEHFKRFKPLLVNRNVRTGSITVKDYDDFVRGRGDVPYVMIKSAFAAGKFFCVSYARDEYVFNGEKIVCPQFSPRNTFAFDNREWFAASDVYFIKRMRGSDVGLKYLLALLNSKLCYFWLYHKGQRKGDLLQLFKGPLSEIPVVRASDGQNQAIEALTDRILAAKQRDAEADVSALEREIDELVYALYGLTPEEKALVQAAAK